MKIFRVWRNDSPIKGTVALATDLSLVINSDMLANNGGVPEDLSPSSGFDGHCMHMVHIHTHKIQLNK